MQDISIFLNHHLSLTLSVAAVIVLLLIIETLRARKNTFNISPLQLTQLINKQNAAVIDIRHIDAFRSGHIIGAQAMSVSDIQKNTKKLEKYKDRPIVIVSNTPLESQKIAVMLLKQGYNAFSLLGGIKSWHEAQMPLIKEGK